MRNSNVIANRLLEFAQQKDQTLSPMQVIKLVYLCHGWMLGIVGRSLVKEDIEAWKYGPVIASLYHDIKHFRSQPVEGPLDIESDDQQLTDIEEAVVGGTYRAYGRYTGIALSQMTHADGTPWYKTWHEVGNGEVISNDLIEEHFADLWHERNHVDAEPGEAGADRLSHQTTDHQMT